MDTSPCFSGLLIVIYTLPRILLDIIQICLHTVFLLTIWSSDINVWQIYCLIIWMDVFVFIIHELRSSNIPCTTALTNLWRFSICCLDLGSREIWLLLCFLFGGFRRKILQPVLNKKWPKYLTLLNVISNAKNI